jgi:hypothetical protein
VRQFSRLLAAEVCALSVLMVVLLDKPHSEVVRKVLVTHSIRQFPLLFPNPYVTVCHHISTGVYFQMHHQSLQLNYSPLGSNSNFLRHNNFYPRTGRQNREAD